MFLILTIFPTLLEKKLKNNGKIEKYWIIDTFCKQWCDNERKRNMEKKEKIDFK